MSQNQSLFPNLIEITDYLLIFQAQNITNLDILFPKLSIIRGNNLFRNYALVLFLSNSLLQVNLKNLIQIDKGSILLSRLYHACYVNTIDWNYLIQEKTINKPTLNLLNNDCISQSCSSKCPDSNCWNENNCQKKCPNECPTNCNLANTSQCCSDPSCLYCSPDPNTCISCAKYRNLSNGKCVEKCSKDSLIYNNNICLRKEDCSLSSSSLIQNYTILENKCVSVCPIGYKISNIELTIKNETLKFQKCIKCKDNICKRDCSDQIYHLKSVNDLVQIKNCFKVKRLSIELGSEVNQHSLIDNLKHLEEIEDYLLITRNRYLVSLNFFQSLRKIHGRSLFERKFSLFIHTNSKLRDLWKLNNQETLILNGSVKFFENPNLCFQTIEEFMLKSNVLNAQDSDISFNFNGYRRLTCSNQTIELGLDPKSNKINVNWNVTVSDVRRLKGYILFYAPISNNLILDQNEMEYKSDLEKSDLEWMHLYVDYDEKTSKHLVQTSIDVEPFTRYAVYVKADLTINFDSKWINRTLYQYDRIISKINYVYSLPARKYKILL